MNRLNKIILSFVLPFFCLLVSVSSALEFGTSELGTAGHTNKTFTPSSIQIGDYTLQQGFNLYYQAFSVGSTYKQKSSEALASYKAFIDACTENGYIVISSYASSTNRVLTIYDSSVDLGIKSPEYSGDYSIWSAVSPDTKIYNMSGTSSNPSYSYIYTVTGDGFWGNSSKLCTNFNGFGEYLTNASIKELNNNLLWSDGLYYYEAPSSEDPDSPSLPSNSEIASAVQAFYNSDYYKNNKDFEDFLVLYNTKTGYFSFVGHNFGNKLGQQIIDPDVSVGSPPVSYNQRWWHFYLVGLSEFTSTLFNKYYWLYGTSDFGENFEYQGKGSINDLLDVHFATTSTIIYSTTDYPVTIMTADGAQADIIPGDQYTYDENLDPTTNEYNPLENFVPTSPSQTILGDVDFDEINKTFEENKDILNIENASWLFTANNQLTNYFIGFLSLLIVFLIISRILGG